MATNGERALHILAQPDHQFSPANPVLVLLDLNMPVMDGFKFLEAFPALPPAQQRGVTGVVLTSSLNWHDLDCTNYLPVAGYFNKPLDEEKITTLLQIHFGPQVAAE